MLTDGRDARMPDHTPEGPSMMRAGVFFEKLGQGGGQTQLDSGPTAWLFVAQRQRRNEAAIVCGYGELAFASPMQHGYRSTPNMQPTPKSVAIGRVSVEAR